MWDLLFIMALLHTMEDRFKRFLIFGSSISILNAFWFLFPVSEMGDDIRECYNEECLLLVNHQSTGDVVTLMSSLQNKGATCARVYWIMDHIFLYTNFGWVSLCHGDFFLQQVQ